jgi:hypothetical protein
MNGTVHAVNTDPVGLSIDQLGELIERRQLVVLGKISTRVRRIAAAQAELHTLRLDLVNVREDVLMAWAGIDDDEDEEVA